MLKTQNTDRTYRTRFGAAFGQSASDIGTFIGVGAYGVAASLIISFPFLVVDCYRDVKRDDSGKYVGRIYPEMARTLKKDAL